MPVPALKNVPCTYEDYSALGEGAPYQLIEGELVMSPAPVPYHQRISRRIEMKLNQLVEEQNLGEVFDAPIDVYLSETNTFQPDIIFISKERLEIIGEKKIEGAPDLAVEILSPGTAYYDLKQKKRLYESAGVREYWIVDPLEKSIEVFELQNGIFVSVQEAIGSGEIRSRILPGFAINIEDIF